MSRSLFQQFLELINALRKRPVPAKAEEINDEVKSTRKVCPDDEKIGQIGFQRRPNHQIWAVRWPQSEISSIGGGGVSSMGSDMIAYLGNVG